MRMKFKILPGVPYEMDAGDNPTFEKWMNRVDAYVWGGAGVSVHDLPGCDFRIWYEERLRPVRAADRAVRRA